MKIRKHHKYPGAMAAAALLVVTAVTAHAGDSASGWYMGTDLGANIMSKLTVPGTGSVTADTGLRWDGDFGYAIKVSDHLSIAPELEIGLLYNGLNKATPYGGPSHAIDAEYYQVPVLANLVLNWHFNPHWVAYAGAGGGADVSSLSSTGTPFVASETDAAWQVLGGIRYKFGGACDAGVGYKYLAVQPTGLKTIGNSAITASFTYHF